MADARLTTGYALALTKAAPEAHATQANVTSVEAGMASARTTQAAVLALTPEPVPARITAADVHVLTQSDLRAQLSQAGIRALVDEVPCLTRWAQCWRIERTDGEVFTFTSHDRPIDFRGETYQPCDSLSASASELAAVLGSVGNIELGGIISDESITERDIYGGLFDRASIEVWMIPWDNPRGDLPMRLVAGVTGNLSQGEVGYTAEILTPGGQLQQRPLLDTYTPGCRWELGDSRCKVNLDALAVTGSATAVASKNSHTAASHRTFTDSTREEEDGYFDLGRLVWTSGRNTGFRSEIKTYAGGTFTLWHPMLYPIEAGDEYEARPGCDKTPDTCKTKFDNYVNFGGFPDVPGTDAVMQTPNAK